MNMEAFEFEEDVPFMGEPLDRRIYQKALEHVSDLVLLVGPNLMLTRSLRLNAAFRGTVPVHSKELMEAVHPDDRMDLVNRFMRLPENKVIESLEFRYKAAGKDEEWIWVEAVGFLLEAEGEEPEQAVLVLKEITDRKQNEDNLRYLSFHDPLTDLPNRRLFRDRLLQSMAYAKRNKQMLAVLYLDIDDFKIINDTRGHAGGDKFLRSFADRVKKRIREVDTLARIGGDEFSILLNSIDSEASVEQVIERIHKALQEEWHVDGVSFRATASIGAAIFPDHGEDPAVLQKNVDIALYEVKSKGRNNFLLYKPGMGSNQTDCGPRAGER